MGKADNKTIAQIAKAMRARAERVAPLKAKLEVMAPTAEQMRNNVFKLEDVTDKRNGAGSITIGKAYRRRPMIDILAEQRLLSEAEHKALKHYRHHADLADRSLTKDSLAKGLPSRSGDCEGPTHSTLNAIRVVADIEAAAGSLRDILRAVVVYDLSLSQWAIEQQGAIQQCRDRKGRRICTIEPKRNALRIAQLEIKLAAGRVESEISA